MTARNILIILLLIIGAAAALFYFSGRDYVLKFTESELTQKLEDRMPLTKTYLVIFDVTLADPRIDLIEGSDRVQAGVDIVVNIKIGGQSLPLRGALDVSGGVEYRAESAELYLTDPVIEDMRIKGAPSAYADRMGSVLTRALAYFYETRPIYSLEGAAPEKVAARLILKDVVVRNEELIVTLGLGGKRNSAN